MKKILFLIILLLFFSPGNITAQEITVAVVPKGMDNPVFIPAQEGARAEGEKLGVKVLWIGPPETDTAGQIATIKALISKKVNAIALSANDANAFNDVIAEAVKAGIIVATWDSDTNSSQRLYYIGTDNYKGGFQCGQEMIKLIGKNKKIFALSGASNAANLNTRIQGFKDAVKDADIEVIDTLYCEDNIDQSMNLIEMYLKNNPDIDGLFMVGGWPLFGSASKMVNLKAFKGGVVCFDYFPQGKDYITGGLIDVCVGQNFYNMGMLSVRYLVDVIRNGARYPEINDSGSFRVDKDNIKDY